jgi:tetratricopeptide (TPR) repeat protein
MQHHHWPRTALLFLVLAATTATSAVRAEGQTPNGSDVLSGPSIDLYDGEMLGTYHWPISTQVPRAQAYFDQGVRLMFAYTPLEARFSFQEAWREDPSCAMCWWGEAWSMGPTFNGGMAASSAPRAYEAAQRALSLAPRATPVERALIEALAVRYTATHPGQGRRGLDSAYVAAMAEAYVRFQEDDEVGTLYADALMLLEPRRGAWPLTKPSVNLIHEVLEGVLVRDLGHPGACHAYVHATETTPSAHRAQACADLLGNAIPGASHINHMPSHTYNRVGRWGDATAANIQAWQTDLRSKEGEGIAIYPSHNLHMLYFSAAVDGQGALSIQSAKDYAKMDPENGASFRALALLRFGRFDEVLELTRLPTHPAHRGLVAFARGLAHLRLEHPDSAAWYLTAVDSIARDGPEYRFRVHSPAQLLGVVGPILRGEILRTEGRMDEATQAFQQAIVMERQLTYDEPEPLPFTARDFLGAHLLEYGRADEAVRVYEAALEARPHNGWSLFGLEKAMRAVGRTAEADEVHARFERAWARSEVLLKASRF